MLFLTIKCQPIAKFLDVGLLLLSHASFLLMHANRSEVAELLLYSKSTSHLLLIF